MFQLIYNSVLSLVYPPGSCCVCLAGALVFRKRKRLSLALLSAAVGILMVFGNRLVVHALARPLERKHVPAHPLPAAQAIVSLGSGARPASGPRPTPSLGHDGDRIIYAAELYHEGKAPLVVCTGGIVPGSGRQHPGSTDIATLLKMLGVPAAAIVEEPRSRSTFEDAIFTRDILRTNQVKRVLLVTSAVHMPRALAVFRKQCPDIEFTPAPTDFGKDWDGDATLPRILWAFVPKAEPLAASNLVIHEYLGLVYYKLRGWI